MPNVNQSQTKIPSLGVGAFRLKDDEAYNSVTMALEVGFRHIDTAQIYGNEEAVGRAINDAIANNLVAREDLYVTTKVWNDKLNKASFVDSVKRVWKSFNCRTLTCYLFIGRHRKMAKAWKST